MSYTSTASSYRTLSQYWDARSQFSTSSVGPPSREPSTPLDRQTRELLANIDNHITATACGTASLPALITNLSAYLLAKESDGIPETALGRPHLNQQVKYAMLKCKDHPRFGELRISDDGREGGAPDFATVWAMLERHAREWKEGADRKKRLHEGINLHKVQFWLMNVELDGEICRVGGEEADDDDVW